MRESAPLEQKILFSLFGEPLHQDIGTTIDGQRAYERIDPLNPTLILTLLISAFLFAVYMWFYLSPLFRRQPSRRKSQIFDPEMGVRNPPAPKCEASTDAEKKSLVSWIHRSSLGRFIDATGLVRNHNSSHGRPTRLRVRPPCVEDYQFLSAGRALSTPSSPLSSPPILPLPLHAWSAQQDIALAFLTPPPPAYSALLRSDGVSSQFLEPRMCHSCSLSLPSLSLSPPPDVDLSVRQSRRLGEEVETGVGRGTDPPIACGSSTQAMNGSTDAL